MLEITEHAVGHVTVLQLVGRLVMEDGDTALCEHVDRLLRETRAKIVLDLSEVTYVDSAGLGALVSKYVSVRRRGGDLRLVHPTARTTRLFEVTKLSSVFEVFASETDAVQSFAAS